MLLVPLAHDNKTIPLIIHAIMVNCLVMIDVSENGLRIQKSNIFINISKMNVELIFGSNIKWDAVLNIWTTWFYITSVIARKSINVGLKSILFADVNFTKHTRLSHNLLFNVQGVFSPACNKDIYIISPYVKHYNINPLNIPEILSFYKYIYIQYYTAFFVIKAPSHNITYIGFIDINNINWKWCFITKKLYDMRRGLITKKAV